MKNIQGPCLALLALLAYGCDKPATTTENTAATRKDPGTELPLAINPATSDAGWEEVKAKESGLISSGGHNFNTGLYDLNYHGQIPMKGQAPYLIFSGTYCTDCGKYPRLYLHSPADGAIKTENGIGRLPMPGNMLNKEDGSVLYESRAFYGQVLPGTKGIIWYQNTEGKAAKQKPDIFLVSIENGQKVEKTMPYNEKLLKQTLHLVSQGESQEIRGIRYKNEE